MHGLDFYIVSFPLIISSYLVILCLNMYGFIVIWHVHVYTSLVRIRVIWINEIPYHAIPLFGGAFILNLENTVNWLVKVK